MNKPIDFDALVQALAAPDFRKAVEKSVPGATLDNVNLKAAKAVLDLVDKYNKSMEVAGLEKWFVPGSPFSIENCPKHRAFFDASADYTELLFCAGNRCLVKGTLVATPAGPRAIEDLKVGDYVYDRDGSPTEVLEVHYNGIKPVVPLANRGKVYASSTPDHKFETYLYDRLDREAGLGQTPAAALSDKAKVRRL